MSHLKSRHKKTTAAGLERGQARRSWAIGFGIAALVLITLIALTGGSQRLAFVILFSILGGIVTLVYTFGPVFGDWSGFADGLAGVTTPRWRWQWRDPGDPEYETLHQNGRKFIAWLILGIVAGAGLFALLQAIT
jgi:hypothetical protein